MIKTWFFVAALYILVLAALYVCVCVSASLAIIVLFAVVVMSSRVLDYIDKRIK